MKIKIMLVLGVMSFFAAFDVKAETSPATETVRTSLIKLIANPEKYDGKRVFLIGYGRIGFEESALYLTKDDATYNNFENSIWIGSVAANADKKAIDRFKRGFVAVEGTFRKGMESGFGGGKGHMGLWSGELINITILRKQ